jgi:type II secretory pathway pseudopilin PulG
MIMVISGIGILASIALPQFGTIYQGSQEIVAKEKLEMLNKGVKNHQYASADNLENLLPVPGATRDESRILLQLQYRSPGAPSVGAPYVATKYRPAVSSSASDYRMEWTGTVFRLLTPGQSGAGLKVAFDGSDIGPEVTFPPGYKWSGR